MAVETLPLLDLDRPGLLAAARLRSAAAASDGLGVRRQAADAASSPARRGRARRGLDVLVFFELMSVSAMTTPAAERRRDLHRRREGVDEGVVGRAQIWCAWAWVESRRSRRLAAREALRHRVALAGGETG